MRLNRTTAFGAALATTGLILAMLVPATALASGTTVTVGPSNGHDDTSSLQSALDQCVASGPGCTVQLNPGRYFTKQLVAYNFQGTLRGAGMSDTTIEALHSLQVVAADISIFGECAPNTTTCPWPSLIIFAGGTVHVSDLSIKITAPPGTATTGWGFGGATFTDLIDAIRFMSPGREDATVDRVSIQGLPDNSPTTISGFNLVNGVTFPGEFPRSATPFDYYFMTGSFTVRNSFFNTMGFGAAEGGFLNATRTTIGGSATAGNRFENVLVGLDMESSQGSLIDVSYNKSIGSLFPMWVVPWIPQVFLPSTPSSFLIHDNDFQTTSSSAGGLFLVNVPQPWFQAQVLNNTIDVQGPGADGIDLISGQGTKIIGNTITGTGSVAIGLWNGTTSSAVIHNLLDGFIARGPGQIFLDSGTTDNLVVCSTKGDTVSDMGTNNQIAGCGSTRGNSRPPAWSFRLAIGRHL